MTKEVKQNDTVAAKNADDQKEMFADASIATLKELVQAFGIPEGKIPADATKADLMNLLLAVKRHDISVAHTVKTQEGKEVDCPPGHMVIKVTPKAAGMEWGNRSREVFFFAVNGECCVGKRGTTVVIPDKYRSCWTDAISHEWTVNETMTLDPTGQWIQPAKWSKREVPAEDVVVLHWNRDLEKEAAVERDLIEGSKRYMAEKASEKALAKAVQQVVSR